MKLTFCFCEGVDRINDDVMFSKIFSFCLKFCISTRFLDCYVTVLLYSVSVYYGDEQV